jgi:hypothetical protein
VVERYERLIAAQRETRYQNRLQREAAGNRERLLQALGERLALNRAMAGPEVSAVPGDLALGAGLTPPLISGCASEIHQRLLAEIDAGDDQ